MPMLYITYLIRDFIRTNSHAIFIFGDNLQRSGFGGQAKACRGEPNAVGVPTKKRPTMADDAFFTDDDYEKVKPVIDKELDKIRAHLENTKTVYYPIHGIGTGRANLQQQAPKIFDYIKKEIENLFAQYP